MEDDDITRWEFRVAQPEDERIRATRESSAKGSGAAAPMAINFEGHLRQIQDFIDGIREQRPFFIEGREARKAVALVRRDLRFRAPAGRPDGARAQLQMVVRRSRGSCGAFGRPGNLLRLHPSSMSVPPRASPSPGP